MHESSIARTASDIILKYAGENKAKKVMSVCLEIGELSFFSPDQVRFWIKTMLKDSIASGIKIKIKIIRSKISCDKCGYKGKIGIKSDDINHIIFPVLTCPKCNSRDIKVIEGKECTIRTIEMLK